MSLKTPILPDRIELYEYHINYDDISITQPGSLTYSARQVRAIAKKDGFFTDEEIRLCEDALNGSLLSKNEIINLISNLLNAREGDVLLPKSHHITLSKPVIECLKSIFKNNIDI